MVRCAFRRCCGARWILLVFSGTVLLGCGHLLAPAPCQAPDPAGGLPDVSLYLNGEDVTSLVLRGDLLEAHVGWYSRCLKLTDRQVQEFVRHGELLLEELSGQQSAKPSRTEIVQVALGGNPGRGRAFGSASDLTQDAQLGLLAMVCSFSEGKPLWGRRLVRRPMPKFAERVDFPASCKTVAASSF